jgi:DNA (cytosine-5)-methyltransferase 3A
MNVLSLFDGMSCGQIALKEHGFVVEKYYASEIDKFAIKQTQLNFPDTIQLGSVTEWRTWDIDWSSINLICAGSPCQGFSFAGKQLAFDDPRSKLFFVFVEILNHCRKFNPEVRFLLENVDMKKDHLRIISEYVEIFPTKINSALVSAQNRERWYWTNIRTKQIGLFDELYTDIPQPIDEGILLRDILQPENEVDQKYYLSDKMLQYFDNRASNFNAGKVNIREENGKASTILASSAHCDISDNFIKVDRKGNIKSNQNKADSLTVGGHGCGNHSDMDVICSAKYYDKNTRELDQKGASILASSYKGNQANGMTLIKTGNLRRLTPIECSRLQTIPSWYKWECSDSQIYRMLGNGWTVKVIQHIISFI